MQVKFSQPGTYELEAYYDGPPYWRIRNLVMCITVFLLWKLGRKFALIHSFKWKNIVPFKAT